MPAIMPTAESSPAPALLREGRNCWRLARADRAALLIDGAAYFAALEQALRQARRSVFIVGWDIRSEISLDPGGTATPLNAFLAELVRARRELEIRILVWDWTVLFALDREFLPRLQFRTSRRLRFEFDSHHPAGGCQHEKVVVIDGTLAFCGGIDLSAGRWDLPEHRPDEPRRRGPRGTEQRPFHDAMLMVEGEAARALEDLVRERWRHATGAQVPPAPATRTSAWPDAVDPWLQGARVGVARTRPHFGGQAQAREVEALFLDAIGAARERIYIENQYLTVPAVATTLAERLREADGPEIVIISPDRCEGFLETAAMDRGRDEFCKLLRDVGRDDRLRIMHPVHEVAGQPPASINVHAKLMIVDDRLLIIGSANLAKRSMSLDTECDLAIEAGDEADRQALARARHELLAEHLGCTPAALIEAAAKEGSLIAALDALNGGPRRLERLVIDQPPLPPELEAGVALTDADEPITAASLQERLVPASRRRRLQGLALQGAVTLVLLIGLALLLRGESARDSQMIVHALQLAEAHGLSWQGLAGVLLAYTLSSLVLVPVNLLIAATGAAFGPLLGFGYAVLGSLVAAAVVFGVGRALGSDPVRRFAGRRVNAVSRRLDRHGLLAMALLRLLPIAPFGVVNLVAGAAEMRFRDFLLGSLIGMAPGIALMTLFGDRLGVWLRRPDPVNLAILVGAALAVLALALVLGRWARRRGGR
ncbi:MAG TPA: VTT domain-containing protein [Geminicoccaceae bacterium]|nr:VTT domain-containing protein [Geminicoccaceae bacterium]